MLAKPRGGRAGFAGPPALNTEHGIYRSYDIYLIVSRGSASGSGVIWVCRNTPASSK